MSAVGLLTTMLIGTKVWKTKNHIKRRILDTEDIRKKKQELSAQYARERQKVEDERKFRRILNKAFSKDPVEAFMGSIELAKIMEVPDDEILDSKEKIDRYFMGE